MNIITFEKAAGSEYPQILALVRKVFDQTVGIHYSPEGQAEFYTYIDLEAFTQRQQTNHFCLVAKDGQQVIGVIEVRDFNHVAMLFVDEGYRGQGIGKSLLAQAVDICKYHNPELDHLTVNSAVHSCPVYKKMGFVETGSEQEKNGIRFTPMELKLPPATPAATSHTAV